MPLFKLALQAKNIQEAYKKQKLTTPRGIIYYVVLALQEAKTNLVKVDGGIVMLLMLAQQASVSTYYPD
jgi:hypothetical protein